MPDNLILVGFMGAGKDVVGRAIARKTGRACLSLDRLIELQTGLPIADIFMRSGESGFRKIEKAALASIRDLKNIVLATGGGTVLDPHNRRRLKQMGLVVHLRVDQSAAEQRLKNDRSRPLIRDKKRIREIFKVRRGRYDFADWSIDTTDRDPEQVADRIIEKAGMENPARVPVGSKLVVRSAGKTYPVLIGAGLFSDPKFRAPAGFAPGLVMIVTNPVVGALYEDRIAAAFRKNGLTIVTFIIPAGERHKTIATACRVYDALLRHGFARDDCLIALGGGVITDLTGFVAATYKRGMKLIHVPTTLLGQVDAAIGGKTGVNHPSGKNAVGAFYPPDLVGCDPTLLLSLPDAEFRNGLAEVIKYGVVGSERLISRLEANPGAVLNRDPVRLAGIIRTCVAIKRRVVERDEREEKGSREILNFGHTIGHALEARYGYRKYPHGAAVAVGMVWEAERAVRQGLLARRDRDRIKDLLIRFGLPLRRPFGVSARDLKNLIRQDKKIRAGRIRLPVPVGIGKTLIKEVAWENFW